MTIVEELLNSIEGDAPIRSLLVGAHWTVVCSRGCGLASTLMNSESHGHHPVREAGYLHQKTARQLAEYILSENQLEASIGMAALNSLLPVEERDAVEINAAEVLADRGRGKKIAIVGHFPFIDKLRESAGELWVIELNPAMGDYPAEAAPDLIPQADLVAITGTALINHSMDQLLGHCQPDALVMVLGPSTPLSPVLFDHGARFISGVKVIDESAVFQTAGQGANFPQIEGVKLLTKQRSHI